MLVGYGRVSTQDQELHLHRMLLKRQAVRRCLLKPHLVHNETGHSLQKY